MKGWRACAAVTLGALALAPAPARAQWTRVAALPAADVYCVEAHGDTILAGVEQGVWVSVNGGASWTRSADLPAPPVSAESVRLAGGQLWCGTYGQGVFRSGDLGATWQPHNPGLTGGLFNSHLYVLDFEVRGDSLFAATDGAGVYALRLSTLSAWSGFGAALVGSTAGSVPDLQVVGDRMLAAAGGNGCVFHNDRGEADWTLSFLDNSGVLPGLQARRVAWDGASWLVATQLGCFASAAGESPWTAIGPSEPGYVEGYVASGGGRTMAARNTLGSAKYWLHAGGSSWEPLETFLTNTYDIALQGGLLYAARGDGLWARRTTTDAPGPPAPSALRLTLAGANPVREVARFRFALPAAGRARLEVFDVAGRQVARVLDRELPSGEHEVAWEAAGRAAGVYFARLGADGNRHAVARFVLGR